MKTSTKIASEPNAIQLDTYQIQVQSANHLVNKHCSQVVLFSLCIWDVTGLYLRLETDYPDYNCCDFTQTHKANVRTVPSTSNIIHEHFLPIHYSLIILTFDATLCSTIVKALLNNDIYITEEILTGSWKNILGRLKKKKTVEVIKERES